MQGTGSRTWGHAVRLRAAQAVHHGVVLPVAAKLRRAGFFSASANTDGAGGDTIRERRVEESSRWRRGRRAPILEARDHSTGDQDSEMLRRHGSCLGSSSAA